MSFSITKGNGLTVLTLSSDPKSPWPPLCQILKALCCNPLCCAVSQHLRRQRRVSQTVLGTLQIMIALLNIGLGTILLCSRLYLYTIRDTAFPIWLGILFIIFGSMSILSEKFPSPCLLILNVILNLAGVAFAITGVVLYSISIGTLYFWWDCSPDRSWDRPWDRFSTTQPPSYEDQRIREQCMMGKEIILILLRGLLGVLIVLSAMELCVTISSVVLGIKTLKKQKKEEDEKSSAQPDDYKRLLDDVDAGCPA